MFQLFSSVRPSPAINFIASKYSEAQRDDTSRVTCFRDACCVSGKKRKGPHTYEDLNYVSISSSQATGSQFIIIIIPIIIVMIININKNNNENDSSNNGYLWFDSLNINIRSKRGFQEAQQVLITNRNIHNQTGSSPPPTTLPAPSPPFYINE